MAAYALHRRRIATKINIFLGVTIALGAGLALAGAQPWGAILVAAGLCGLVGEAVQARLYIPAKVRKLYGQYKGIDAPVTYTWTADAVSVHSERGRAERKWGDLHKVAESDAVFLLYTTDALFEVVPKRWFASPEQAADFGKHACAPRPEV